MKKIGLLLLTLFMLGCAGNAYEKAPVSHAGGPKPNKYTQPYLAVINERIEVLDEICKSKPTCCAVEETTETLFIEDYAKITTRRVERIVSPACETDKLKALNLKLLLIRERYEKEMRRIE